MARKGLTGQLNMFDLFKSLDDIPMGEVEMVSLMPEPEVEPELTEEAKPKTEPMEEPKPDIRSEVTVKKNQKSQKQVAKADITKERPVMCRRYETGGKTIEIAYINYNKVRIVKDGEEPEIYEFDSSKEAVDYYVQRMQELEPEE